MGFAGNAQLVDRPIWLVGARGRELRRLALARGLLLARSQQRDGDVEHAAGGLGNGELASRPAVAAGSAGDRVHDGGLVRWEESLDGELAPLQLQVHGGHVEWRRR